MNPELKETDRCVMCGMCLPHCPTYGQTHNEADSPRGRISLIQAFNTGRLPVDEHMLAHLDGCLSCRACESICPSGVPYGQLIDAARKELSARRPRHRLGRALGAAAVAPFVQKRGVRRAAAWGLWFYQRVGIQFLLRRTRVLVPLGLARAESYLPTLAAPHALQDTSPAQSPRGTVALFTGCVADVFDRETLAATQRLLTRLGWKVIVPPQQTCCGALYQHNGRPQTARRLADQNLRAFGDEGVEAIISTASGCGAQLADYAELGTKGSAQGFASRVRDVGQFLVEKQALQNAEFSALKSRVAIHNPCSLTHVLKQAAHPRTALGHIPGIELVDLPDNAVCCGAAGSYMLTQPKMADALLDDKLEHIEAIKPDILVTSNAGCALHFKAGIRRAGLGIEVIHPAVLLERQLKGDVGV